MEITSFFILAGSASVIGLVSIATLLLLKEFFLKKPSPKLLEYLKKDIEMVESAKHGKLGIHEESLKSLKLALSDLKTSIEIYERNKSEVMLNYMRSFLEEANKYLEIVKNTAKRYGNFELARALSSLDSHLSDLRKSLKSYELKH